MEKECKVCGLVKELTDYHKSNISEDGVRSTCKECRKIESRNRYENNKDYFIKYRNDNNEKILLGLKEWRLDNPNYRKNYYIENEEKEREYSKNYHHNNKEKIKKYYRMYNKKRWRTDPIFKMKSLFKGRLRKILKEDYTSKPMLDIVGVHLNGLKEHLESLFTEGMTWDNHGEWHIDHIIPLATAKTNEDVYKLFHYKNLQPLWAEDNLLKSDKIINEIT